MKLKEQLDFLIQDCKELPAEDNITKVKESNKDDVVAQLRLF